MAIRVLVAGVDCTSYLWMRDQPPRWEDLVNGRGQLSIQFRDHTGAFRPTDGQEIILVEDQPEPLLTADGDAVLTAEGDAILTGPERLFGGHLIEPEEYEIGCGGLIVYNCAAIEYSAVCDRRLVPTRIYEAETLDAIVLDIVARDLAGEGIGTDGVDAGPLVEKAVFSYIPVTEAFNTLAELTGRSWWIDVNKRLQFRTRDAILAPSTLGAGTFLAGTVRVQADREKYRNKQVVRAGTDLTDPRIEIQVGDGVTRVFGLTFPIGAEPTVDVSRAGGAWTPQTVGILGVETGKDWYWNLGQPQVSQDDSGTLLAVPTTASDPTTGDRVRVTYQGLFPILVQYTDSAEIASRQAIEGGTGIWESIEHRPQINSGRTAIDTARALVDRYGRVGTVVTGRTRVAGFRAGQLVTIDLPKHGLHSEACLIESLTADVKPMQEVWYTIRAITGDAFGGWQEYFRKLVQAGRSLVIEREGEILVMVRLLDAPVACGASLAVTSSTPSSAIGVLEIGLGEIAA